MSTRDPLDLPTSQALVRLRLLTEDAQRRALDFSEAGRHLALIALDGACEYALWLVSREHGVALRERAGVPELYGAVKTALADWRVRGWAGVNQMHQARNVAQHAGVVSDVAQLASWRDATAAFIDSLCRAAFGTPLAEIALADAVRNPDLQRRLTWSEEQLAENPAQSFSLSLAAFDDARQRWRAQRIAPVSALSPGGDPPGPDLSPPLRDVDDLLEVQPFAGDIGEYMWLRRARREHELARWLPAEAEARRALLFVTGWIVRWEIFDQGYPEDRWEAHREGIEPPVTGDGAALEILGAQVELLPEVPGRPARNIVYLQLANVPNRGRSPWDLLLRDALMDATQSVDQPSLFLDAHWYLSGVLAIEVAVDADSVAVSEAVVRGAALAAQRHAQHVTESEEQERDRQRLETELRDLIYAARDAELGLFAEVRVVKDEWLGTMGWLAFLDINVGDPGLHELSHTHNAFGNFRHVFPNLHQREHSVVFSIDEVSNDLAEAIRSATAMAEHQARHVREHRARQAQTFRTFADSIHRRFGPLP